MFWFYCPDCMRTVAVAELAIHRLSVEHVRESQLRAA